MSEKHPEPAEIAELDEGLLSPAEAAGLREHLTHCPRCAAVHDDLTLLRQTLADETDPGPIPDDVVLRIDAALAAEASRPIELPPVSRETAPPQRRRSRGRFMLAAAGAALAVGLGGVLLQTLGTVSEDGAASDAAANSGAAEEAIATPSELPVEYLEGQVRELLEDTEQSEASAAEEPPTQEPPPEPEAPAPPPVSTSAPSDTPPDDPTEEPDTGGLQVLSEMPICVDEAINRPEEPLAVNAEDYQGMDAYLVVLPHSEDPELVTAYVVDAQCVSADPPVTGEILLEESYPRD
ncbi:zf-HC2 domain-containing protein [Streptomyces sp. DSM 44915]|uniref:Zf-HC2 domain-containing protein n=1 Tax=Streptomyces chisholmiae TaxID=3075540 RepID=A0ABU2JQ40_9ACTN|nr:zf-HC2 domain-containing protein [Streptomyces sp. DSM 44915]MDT0267101.1 zf-HC2 domain-containing protein [Streptomyces sp. DSM 44915]